MRSLFAVFAVFSFLSWQAPAFAADREAVAHIVEVELAGEDLNKGTVVVR